MYVTHTKNEHTHTSQILLTFLVCYVHTKPLPKPLQRQTNHEYTQKQRIQIVLVIETYWSTCPYAGTHGDIFV